ncbi:hypothetical protein [Geobacter sp. OR-1]|uniref:hypothetical protein n=1 Tax=Geobacter sp. OR-1 TaxID=1266765 RepID=UPI000A559073|nr:hypothetical protein [Geobacter sp. OR-1]
MGRPIQGSISRDEPTNGKLLADGIDGGVARNDIYLLGDASKGLKFNRVPEKSEPATGKSLHDQWDQIGQVGPDP